MTASRSGARTENQTQFLLLGSDDIATFLGQFVDMLVDRLAAGERRMGCAVTLLRDRRPSTVASSSPRIEALDERQNNIGDGPCLTAVREHAVIRVGDVRDDTRWPKFLAVAAEQGVRSVLGVPFELGDEAAACLNVYSDKPHDFSPEQIEDIRHEVEGTSKALLLAVRMVRQQENQEHLHAAMASRTTIDLAVGILMAQNRCSQEEAVKILKSASSNRNVKVRDLAAQLVTTFNKDSAVTHFDG